MTEKILCIQLKQIGDVLMTTPAVRYLAKKYPQAEIHFLTQSPADAVYRYNPHVTRTICFPTGNRPGELIRLAQRLRRERYRTVIDFFGTPKSAVLTWMTGSPERIGFRRRGRTIFYSRGIEPPAKSGYSALQKLHLVTPDPEPADAVIEFHLGDPERRYADALLETLGVDRRRPLISVSPVSRRVYKVWSAENFARVSDELIEKWGAQVLFVWGPGEQHFVDAVRNRMQQTALPNYPVPSIGESAALLAAVDLHIGNDNGPMHFAIAAGTPTVAIFGRPLAGNWTPPDHERHLAVEYDPGCKLSCHYPNCELECIRKLPIQPVLNAIEQQLDRRGAGLDPIQPGR